MSARAVTPSALELSRRQTGLLIVDAQERLAAAMPAAPLARAQRGWLALIEMAGQLELPVVVSEQYPKGLGRTAAELTAAMARLSTRPVSFEKLTFSACEAAEGQLTELRPTWLVVGMECHVCVYQTVRGLLQKGATIHVPADAVLARAKSDWQIGLSLMASAGAIVTSVETALFDLVGRAGTDEFRALSRLIK